MPEIRNLNSAGDVPESDEAVYEWIARKMAEVAAEDENGLSYLLAHADDGAIWGKYLNGQFLTSHGISQNSTSASISPELRGITLQQAFIFNPTCEVRLFRDELRKWQAREVIEIERDRFVEELQIVSGNRVRTSFNGEFTHVYDLRQQGLDQIVPIDITQKDFDADLRARLRVRHFIAFDDQKNEKDISQQGTGEARLVLSRLVNVEKIHAAQA